MLCGSPIEIWNCASHVKRQNIKRQNTKSIGEKLKTKGLMFFVSFFFMWFARYPISIFGQSLFYWVDFAYINPRIFMLMEHCTVQSPKYSNMHVPFSIQFTVLLSFASLCSSSSHCYSKTKFEARVCICASAYNTRQQSQGSLINYVVTWRSL